jgi:hypothetical protein
MHMMWWPGAEKFPAFVAPWIADFHDEHMVEAHRNVAVHVMDAYDIRLQRLNRWLDPHIKIEAPPETVNNLAEVKCAEEIEQLKKDGTW